MTCLLAFFALAPLQAVDAANTAPTIWGKPATVAYEDARYDFRPGASDADGNKLTFSVLNKPAWMWFDATTGKLSGIPRSAQVNRTFTGITIRVSDGMTITKLPAFSIYVRPAATREVTLNWVPPTRNSDGTALTNLAGYIVFYGKGSRQYSQSFTVWGAGARSATVQGLSSGTWYFAVKAFTNTGQRSVYSAEAVSRG